MNGNLDNRLYLCTAEKGGKVVDLALIRSLDAALVFNAIKRSAGFESCNYEIEYTQKKEPVKAAAKRKKKPRKWAKRVRCIETGEVYDCLSDLQKIVGMKRWALEGRISRKIPISGKTYEFIEK